MQFGLNPVQSDPSFAALIHQTTLAESVGFDAIWTYEHHSRSARTYPDPLLSLALLTAQTTSITLGTNMVLLPLHHPLDVAERAAMVDAASGGRLVLGVSAGYAAHEFAAFGASLETRGARMEAGLREIREAWSRSRSDDDGAEDDDAYALFPAPVQVPGPPIYVGGLSRAAIQRAAQLGDGFVVSSATPAGEVAKRIDYYRAAVTSAVAAGSSPPRLPIALNRIMHVARNGAAKREAEDFFGRRFLSIYRDLGHDDVKAADAQMAGTGDQSYEALGRDYFIIAEPAECVELVQRYAEMGVGHIACLMNFGEPDVDKVNASIELFAERVLPECRGL